MASMSFLYPTSPIDLLEYVHELPDDNSIPGFPEWKYIFTPGHTPGHISLFREKDKVLIAGDAFVTTQSESAISALIGIPKISGPPKYLTTNWASAKLSVMKLAALDPEVIATGHGRPMSGEEMRLELNNLSRHFDSLALPSQGRYVNEPVIADANGIKYVPKATEQIPGAIKTIGIALALFTVGVLAYQHVRKQNQTPSLKKLLSLQ
jgi:glyoxylase-like metal-dependent hydrolase (beta-lactamase superfamily II)